MAKGKRSLRYAGIEEMPEGMRKLLEQKNTSMQAGLEHLRKMPNHAADNSQQRHRALGRLPTGTMNKTETLYSQQLELRLRAGELLWYRFEGIKLRLAEKTFITIDFAVMLANKQLEMHEVKGGHWEDDARAKTKIAAAQYPFQFIAVTPIAKKHGGGWREERF
jgi:hypothetical protein